jgi:hypothetical protein
MVLLLFCLWHSTNIVLDAGGFPARFASPSSHLLKVVQTIGVKALAARGESTIGRVPSAAGADARRRDAGDAGISSRSANAADAPAPPEPFGRIGIAGNLCVTRRQRCPRIASSSRLDLARNTYARDLLYFHHGLLARISHQISTAAADPDMSTYRHSRRRPQCQN